MDRIIQPYGGPAAGAPARAVGLPLSPIPVAAPPKPPGEYLRSLRRRFWLALSVASAVITAGAVVVVRQPNVYRATAQILIETPTSTRSSAASSPTTSAAASTRRPRS